MATLAGADRSERLVVTAISRVRIAALEALYGAIAPTLGTTVADLHTQIAP